MSGGRKRLLLMICFLKLFDVAKCNPPAIVTTKLCSEAALQFWRLAWPFLDDQYTVSIGSFMDKSQDISVAILECGMHQSLVPMKFFLREQFFLLSTQPTGVFRPRSYQGYIFVSERLDLLEKRMKMLATRDATTKMIMILTHATWPAIKSLMKTAWHDHNMLNLLVFSAVESAEQSKYSLHTNYDLKVFAYDPFTITGKDGKRGVIHMYTLPGENEDYVEGILHMMRARLVNIQGYPIKVCIFNSTATVYPAMEEDGTFTRYMGPQGNLVFLMLRTMNFTPSYYNPPDNERYGYLYPDGKMTGGLLEVETNRAELLANLRPVLDYGQRESDFLFPADDIGFAFLVPKANEIFKISFLQVFSPGVSIAITGVYVLMVVTWRYFHQLYHHNCRLGYVTGRNVTAQELSFLDTCFFLFGTAILISQPTRRLNYERCLFAGMLLFSMVNCYMYQGKMVEHLSTSKKSLDIDTLEELAESDLKILVVTGWKDLVKDIADDEKGPRIYRELNRRMELIDDVPEILRRVSMVRDSAALFNDFGSRINENTLFSNSTGEKLLHILEDGPPKRYNSHMVPKTSPYRDRFNFILMKIRESGLMLLWKEDEHYETALRALKRHHDDSGELNGVYTMKHLEFVFLAWTACCCVCVIVFVAEMVVYFCFQRVVDFVRIDL